MDTITFTKTEYCELLAIKNDLERILSMKKKKSILSKENALRAFGILKNDIKGNSLDYVVSLRNKWR